MLAVFIAFLDVLLVVCPILFVYRMIRAISMRLSLMRKIKSICKDKAYKLQIRRSPLLSLLYKSPKIDLSVCTENTVYHVKLFSSLSKKKTFHFVDEINYVTYLKTFFFVPIGRGNVRVMTSGKTTEMIHFPSYHRLPPIERLSENESKIYVLLVNPLPNEITYVAKNAGTKIAGNGSVIGSLYVFNGKGFCKHLAQEIDLDEYSK